MADLLVEFARPQDVLETGMIEAAGCRSRTVSILAVFRKNQPVENVRRNRPGHISTKMARRWAVRQKSDGLLFSSSPGPKAD
jgi:hypothetical protein